MIVGYAGTSAVDPTASLGAQLRDLRDMIRERPREGIAQAAAAVKYKGRQPTAHAKAGEMHALADSGATREEIARRTSIGAASVYHIVAEGRAA